MAFGPFTALSGTPSSNNVNPFWGPTEPPPHLTEIHLSYFPNILSSEITSFSFLIFFVSCETPGKEGLRNRLELVMRKIYFLTLALLITSTAYTQNVNFDHFPVNYRLYGRQPNNYGIVPISGQVNGNGFTHISIVKSRNNIKIGYQKLPLTYANGVANFSLQDSIKAELAEYAFAAYAFRSATDSVEVAKSINNVAGDFYIVYGQSNAVNWEVDYPYRNEYCRSYGFNPETNGDAWGLSNAVSPRVGIFSITFQSEIAARHQIPTCMISGALAGASVFDLSGRNPSNPTDYNTAYGILLYRARATGLIPFIKGIFYWQGENEAASNNPGVWLPQFEILLGYLQEDFPNVEKIYVFQLPLFGGGGYDDRIGEFREQQRTLDIKHPRVQIYNPGGAPGWDGFHYFLEGSLLIGKELADMAGYNHYGSAQKITSPNFQKAFYSNPEQSEITIVFDDHQTMVWPKDSTYRNNEYSQELFSTYQVKNFFYLNKEWEKIESGRAEANKIILKLKEVKNDTLIKYLPSKYHYCCLPSSPWVYLGPFLKNTQGFRAMAFHHNPIAPYVDLGTINLSGKENEALLELSWNKLPSATGYKLERLSADGQDILHKSWHFSAESTSFSDNSTQKGVTYTYRIRGYTDKNESEISDELILLKTLDNIVLGNEPGVEHVAITAYPNPVRDRLILESKSTLIDAISLYSVNGQKHLSANIQQHRAEIPLTNISPGLYLLKILTEGQIVMKKIIVH